jgi:dihydrofolate synthase/folylpolyglutamate synthase
MKTLTDWLDHCERLHPKNIDMGLERVRTVADRLGMRFQCPVITVAGTNGKGSTCAMLEAILGHAGYRTGVYTSPHLVHFEERLRLSGESGVALDRLVRPLPGSRRRGATVIPRCR